MNIHPGEHLKLQKMATIPIMVLTNQATAPIPLMKKATCYFCQDILMVAKLKKLTDQINFFLYSLLYQVTGGLVDILINKMQDTKWYELSSAGIG